MTSKTNIKKYGLLPHSFKKIGIILLITSVVMQGAILLFHLQTASYKEWMQLSLKTIFVFGLLFVAWSEDKEEDEMTIVLRLKAISFSFLATVFFVLFKPFADILFDQKGDVVSGTEVAIIMLLGYLLMYHLKKSGR